MIQLRRLSLCMIVKNEEDCIGRCLQSVKDIVDEMIIVDTGSTDRTKEICRSFGAQVYDFEWNGSFSDARNYGLERATGDWILWLDADEEVDEAERSRLRDVLYQDSYDLVSIHLINYYGDQVDKDKVFNIAHHRLFRNHIGFKFINKIHELLDLDQVLPTAEDKKRVGLVPIKVYHYGYLTSYVKEKGKSKRNLEMLEKELEQEDYSPWIHYHLASEYYGVQKYKEAFEQVNKSIMKFILEGYTPPALIYKLKYSILISLGSFEGAWPSIDRAVTLYPDYVDLQFYKGIILYVKEMYEEALKTFELCLKLGEENLDYLILKGLGSFQAMYYKGLCHEKLGRMKEAALSYIESVISSHTFSSPIEALMKILEKQDIDLKTWMESHYDDTTIQWVANIIEEHKSKESVQ